MDIEQYLQNIINTCKQHMSSGEWSKNDAIRYAYVTLGKKLSKSTRFFFSLEQKYGDCGLSVEEMKKIHLADQSYEVTCYVSAKMLKRIFTAIGIESTILQSATARPYNMNGETLNILHSYLFCTGDDNKKYFLSPNSDLVNLKFGFKTEHFANDVPYFHDGKQTYSGDEVKYSTLSESEIFKIDKKIGYLSQVADISPQKENFVYANDNPNFTVYGKQRNSTDDYLMDNIENLDNGFLNKFNHLFETFRKPNGEHITNFSELAPSQKRILEKYIITRSVELIRKNMNIPEDNKIIKTEIPEILSQPSLDVGKLQTTIKNLIATNLNDKNKALLENNQTHSFITMSTALSLISIIEAFPDKSNISKLSSKEKENLFFRYQQGIKRLAKFFVPPEVIAEYTNNKDASNTFLFNKIISLLTKDFEVETSRECGYLPQFSKDFEIVEQATYLKRYLRTMLKPELPTEKDFTSRIFYSTLSEIDNKDKHAFLIFVKNKDDIINEMTYAIVYDTNINQIYSTNFLKVRSKYNILSKSIMSQLEGGKACIEPDIETLSDSEIDDILSITEKDLTMLEDKSDPEPGKDYE